MPRKAATKKTARQVSEPSSTPVAIGRSAEVVLDVDVEHDRVHLVLVNCGDAVATDVRVEFSRPLTALGGSLDISGLAVFKRLGVLRPGRSLRIFWDAASALVSRRGETTPFVATVSWNEAARPPQRAAYHHDLSIYRQWPECLEPAAPTRLEPDSQA